VNPARTSAERLKALAACGDPDGLKSAIHELCAEFGKVTSISIMTMSEAEKRRALSLSAARIGSAGNRADEQPGRLPLRQRSAGRRRPGALKSGELFQLPNLAELLQLL
jgi:hypothetical protein